MVSEGKERLPPAPVFLSLSPIGGRSALSYKIKSMIGANSFDSGRIKSSKGVLEARLKSLYETDDRRKICAKVDIGPA